MKPALNEQLKEKFFMLYYGQRVFMMPHFKLPNTLLLSELIGHNVSNGYLSLRPLSDMTDEECKTISEILDIDYNAYNDGAHFDLVGFIEFVEALFTESPGLYIDSYDATKILAVTDYLRSIGIAIPFMGYTVEELIEAGYCKVGKEEGNG